MRTMFEFILLVLAALAITSLFNNIDVVLNCDKDKITGTIFMECAGVWEY